MLRYLLEKNQIKLEDYGLTPLDETFIMEIILGTKENLRSGRPAEKFFLYDIVNNSRSGLDVDKLDYFLRDIRHTNVNVTSVSFDRFFQLGRMLKAEPIRSKYERSSMDLYTHTPDRFSKQHRAEDAKPMYTICYPEKMVGEAVNLFAIRFQMHQKVYTHKSVKKVEYMVRHPLPLLLLVSSCDSLSLLAFSAGRCPATGRSIHSYSREQVS
jgi:HD superfamily phosphohydrolase